MDIIREKYTVKVGEPELYVDNESRGRSGHMTHAMAEFAPGKMIDFNSNCSAKIHTDADNATYTKNEIIKPVRMRFENAFLSYLTLPTK